MSPTMISIRISEEAWQALVDSLPPGATPLAKLTHEMGGVKHWLDRRTHAMLEAARLPGEDESATIIRLAELDRRLREEAAAMAKPLRRKRNSKSAQVDA